MIHFKRIQTKFRSERYHDLRGSDDRDNTFKNSGQLILLKAIRIRSLFLKKEWPTQFSGSAIKVSGHAERETDSKPYFVAI